MYRDLSLAPIILRKGVLIMYNNNQYGYGNNFGGYYGYAQQPQQKRTLHQTLSKEEVNHLRAKGDKQFNLMVTDDDRLRSICNHKDPDTNNIALVRNNDGTYTCSICGERFSVLTDIDMQQAEDIALNYNDLVQTAKTFYDGIPTDVGRELYQTFAFIKKMPQFWEVSMDYADKLNGGQNLLDRNGAGNAFASLSMLTNPGYQPMMPQAMGGYYQQPMQNQPMGYQPMPQQQMTPQQPQMMQAGMYQPQPQMMAPQGQQIPMQQATNYYQPQGSYYDAGMPNPGVDRPIGVVDPTTAAQQPQQNQVVQQTLSAGPSPMAQPQKSQVPNTGDVKKTFKA